jgi:hypothetical protein
VSVGFTPLFFSKSALYGKAVMIFAESTADKKEEGVRYKLPGSGCREGGPGPDSVAYVFVFFGTN